MSETQAAGFGLIAFAGLLLCLYLTIKYAVRDGMSDAMRRDRRNR